MPDPAIEKLTQKNLLTSIAAVVGSELFRHLYVRHKATGQESDAVEDGTLSCALMVSSLLTLHGLIDHPHATVATTLAKMQEAGWYATTTPKAGVVVEWPSHEGHEHIGFMLNGDTFVSNNDEKRVPTTHPAVLRDGREPSAYYWHDSLH